ncbi:MAG: pectate lyase, partial [Candidatus Hydrogenedentes bacterium]|nr:pectate lyase [Candidatus Hydrogenedentota bacterium]
MKNALRKTRYLLTIAAFGWVATLATAGEAPSRDVLLATMRRATDFVFNTLSNRGGVVWLYTMDLEPYGELKARKSMIWVEPPSTPSMGLMLLDAYRITGDTYYLDRARKVGEALAWGQHPSGGWHYFIDFDPAGVDAYYDSFFTKCWGWQEYLKKRTNCTFDDYT